MVVTWGVVSRRIHTMPIAKRSRQSVPAASADDWFASPAGRALLASEAVCIADMLRQRLGAPVLWMAPVGMDTPADALVQVLPLRGRETGFDGLCRCRLPLPLASESCAAVIVQHVLDAGLAEQAGAVLEECARVLAPGGWLWLFALNPLSPYRLHWRGQSLRAREPLAWRRRLRAVGLMPEPVSQGLGPVWKIAASAGEQEGAGLRAGFLLRAQKRVLPLTPVWQRPLVTWQQAGSPA